MVNKNERIVLTPKGLAAANAIAVEDDRIVITPKGLAALNAIANELTDDQLTRIDLLANLALQGRGKQVGGEGGPV